MKFTSTLVSVVDQIAESPEARRRSCCTSEISTSSRVSFRDVHHPIAITDMPLDDVSDARDEAPSFVTPASSV